MVVLNLLFEVICVAGSGKTSDLRSGWIFLG